MSNITHRKKVSAIVVRIFYYICKHTVVLWLSRGMAGDERDIARAFCRQYMWGHCLIYNVTTLLQSSNFAFSAWLWREQMGKLSVSLSVSIYEFRIYRYNIDLQYEIFCCCSSSDQLHLKWPYGPNYWNGPLDGYMSLKGMIKTVLKYSQDNILSNVEMKLCLQ